MNTSTVLLRTAGAMAALLVGLPLHPQTRDAASSYPSRAVRIIVPFAAGAGPDVRARQLGDKLAEQWGQPVIVENRPGAGGQIGMQQAANAAPDGYTLVMAGQSALAIQPHLVKQPFDPLKDFVPVAGIGTGAIVLVVNPKVAVASVNELVQVAQRHPGKLNASSWGNATIPHLALELFKRTAAVDIAHVAYKDAAQSIKDLVAGEVQMTFDFLPILGPQIKAGRLKPLAVSGPVRLSALPDVPTFAEAGLSDMATVRGWQGVAAPAGTPPEIVDKLNRAISYAIARPEMRASYLDVGFDPTVSTPREFAEFIREEHSRWGRLIAVANIRAE
ncbi:MAG TPA: tripartite tricarboxylate transporter substrate binding protein [Burkholderiaceae bacterium]|nr:tripartite tricarboxylate transporter substrate binding protein [Burkholderiaceae bacterium]